jgi:kinase
MYTFLTSSVAFCYHLQMTTSIAIEDVRREVNILKALAGNKNLVQFYDAYEDNENVYIVME